MDLYLPERPKVLYIGDAASTTVGLNSWLSGICDLEVVTASEATAELLAPFIDDTRLILLDVEGSKAGKLCRYFNQSPDTQHLPIVALGRQAQADDSAEFFENGAVDFISMPFEHKAFIARIKAHLSHQFNAEVLRKIKSHYEKEAQRQINEVTATRNVVIHALTALAETRDNSTGYHIQRTQSYVRAIARHLSHHPRFEKVLTPEYIDLLYQSAPLHDIGKVGIPDRILLKPGRLDPDEFEVMKTHPELGRQALDNAERRHGSQVGFLSIAKEIAYCHHEKWDGSGYPQGLKGDAIPLSARLMALADVYDAVISRRVYKEEMEHDKAIDIIIQGRGTHFDPDVVDAFAEIEDEFLRISQDLADRDQQVAVDSSEKVSKNESRPGTVARSIDPAEDQLLAQLQGRIDSISDEAKPFVVSLLTTTSMVPDLLGKVILSMLSKKSSVQVGPVHHALAQMYRAQHEKNPDVERIREISMSLIQACHAGKSANEALRFVLDLPSLLPPDQKSNVPL